MSCSIVLEGEVGFDGALPPHATGAGLTAHPSGRLAYHIQAVAPQAVDDGPEGTGSGATDSYPGADLDGPPSGRLIFLRRTDDTGRVTVLSRVDPVDRHRPYRLVRAELDSERRHLESFVLRRREPADQPLLARLDYEPPAHWFR